MVLTAKVDFKKLIIILAAAAALILALLLLVGGKEETAQTAAPSLSGNDGRVQFLKDLGWEVAASPVESTQVRIPEETKPTQPTDPEETIPTQPTDPEETNPAQPTEPENTIPTGNGHTVAPQKKDPSAVIIVVTVLAGLGICVAVIGKNQFRKNDTV